MTTTATAFAGEIHPVADLFPMLDDEELDDLAKDIAAHGLRQPIVLDQDGRLLDGRNRLEACRRAGVELAFTTYDGDATSFVISQNLKRRHLTISQRATIAAELLPVLQEEARQRQGRRTDLTSSPIGEEVAGTAVSIAAHKLSVGKTSVERAQRLHAHRPDLFQEVKEGKRTVHSAASEAGLEPMHKRHIKQPNKTRAAIEGRNAAIRQLATEGFRPSAIAERVGIDQQTVRNKLHEWGIASVEEKIGKSRRIDANQVLESIVADASPAEQAIAVLNAHWRDLDPDLIPPLIERLSDGIRILIQLRNRLRKEVSA